MNITAYVDMEFGFEQSYLDMGKIRRHQSTGKTVFLVLKNAQKRSLLNVTTDSPSIAFTISPTPSETGEKLQIDVAVAPDAPPGPIEAVITASVADSSYQPSILRVRGNVIGNLEVTPDIIRFLLVKSLPPTKQDVQEIRVFSTLDGTDLKITGLKDRDDRLSFKIDTVAAGQQYILRARPNANALELTRNVAGEVIINTNDEYQPEIRIRYSMIVQK